MASGVWVCNLVAGARPNSFVPRVYQLVQAMPEPRPTIAWSTTSALSTRPRAFGAIVNATSQQITAINADSVCWARELPANWRTLTWSAVPASARNRLTTRLGVGPGIALTDTLPVAMNKILAALDDPTIRSLADLEAMLGQSL